MRLFIMVNHRQSGFSLIELLAVVVLIGIAAGVASVSIGTSGHARALEDSSRYLYGAMQALLEEAVISQRQFGVHFDSISQDGQDFYRYTFLVLDTSQQQWQTYQDADFPVTDLDSGIELSLQVDGQPVVIGGQKKDSFFQLKQVDGETPALLPDIYFLSSGETPNFDIRLSDKADSSKQYHIKSNMLGQMRLIQGDDKEQQ